MTTKNIKNVTSQAPVAAIKRGDFYHNTQLDELYVICNSDDNEVFLANLTNGNRWSSPIVVNNVNNIQPQELNQIMGGSTYFVRVSKIDINFEV